MRHERIYKNLPSTVQLGFKQRKTKRIYNIMSCTFPLCRFPSLSTSGFCFLHNRHFGTPVKKKPSKAINIKSVKRIVTDKLYKKVVDEMRAESDKCDMKLIGCTGTMQGAHHIQKRNAKNMCDRKNLLRALPGRPGSRQ